MFPILLLALAAALPATAESTPEAQKWLDKLVGIYDQGAFLLDFDGTLSLSQPGASMSGRIQGKITYGDSTHLRAAISMRFAGIEAGEEMSMEILNLHDGETIWTDVTSPLLGGRQVTKLSIEDSREFASQLSGGTGIGGSSASLDPVSQLKSMTETMDFEVLGINDGQVELKALLTEEARGNLGQLGAIPGIDSFILTVEEKTGHPTGFRSVSAGDAAPVISMEFDNLIFVDRSRLAADTFVYQIPEGAQILDVGATLSRPGS